MTSNILQSGKRGNQKSILSEGERGFLTKNIHLKKKGDLFRCKSGKSFFSFLHNGNFHKNSMSTPSNFKNVRAENQTPITRVVTTFLFQGRRPLVRHDLSLKILLRTEPRFPRTKLNGTPCLQVWSRSFSPELYTHPGGVGAGRGG